MTGTGTREGAVEMLRRGQFQTCYKGESSGLLRDVTWDARRRESRSSLTPDFQPEQLELMEMREAVGAAGGETRQVQHRVPAGMCEGHWTPVGHPGRDVQAWSSGRGKFGNIHL